MSKEHFTNQSAQNRGSEMWAGGICAQKMEVMYRNGNSVTALHLLPLNVV